MSLPSGYTLLEYIQSSGTQYINTGFNPNQDTRVDVDVRTLTVASGNWWFWGSRQASGSGRFTLFSANGTLGFGFWSTYSSSFALQANTRYALSVSDGVCKVNGAAQITASATTFSNTYPLYLFVENRVGTVQEYGSFCLYSCQIYDNGTLVRDFIPCKNASGAVGLWDDVNSQFYGNAGTGTFTAGPEVPDVGPEPPSNLSTTRTDDTHFTLSWDAVEDADGYKVYRDGALVATQTATSYAAEVKLFSSAAFAVTAYNDDGEGDPATLTVTNIPEDLMSRLITDRTQADVDALNALLAKPMSQWTAAEKAALLGGMKGAYNAADLNRVGAAVAYLAEKFHTLGYAVSVSVKQDWANSDSPTDGDMEVYRDNVAALRAVLAVFADTPATPEDLVRLTWREANDIEKILVDVDQLIQNLQRSWYYSGEVCAGEV